MLSQRQILLRTVIDDPHSTEREKELARKELGGQASQDLQDRELESYLLVRHIPHRSFEHLEIRNSLSPAAKQLLDDICYPTSLGIVPSEHEKNAGTEERLRALLERTKSEMVKQQVIRALQVFERHRKDKA